MINRAPQVMRLAVDPNEHLVQVPAPYTPHLDHAAR
jgi:hypothetical protein